MQLFCEDYQDTLTTTLRPHFPPPTHSVAVENIILTVNCG